MPEAEIQLRNSLKRKEGFMNQALQALDKEEATLQQARLRLEQVRDSSSSYS